MHIHAHAAFTLFYKRLFFLQSFFFKFYLFQKLISDIRYRRVAEIQIFEKTYLIVIKDETGLKFKMNDSTLFLIGSYAQKLVAPY